MVLMTRRVRANIQEQGKVAEALFSRVSGVGASEAAERAFEVAQDHLYHRKLNKFLLIAALGILVGIAGSSLALWQLRFAGVLSEQAAQFWLLCLVISGGIVLVAALTAAGSVLEAFGVMRLAIAKKDNDVLEAIRDRYEFAQHCELFYDLLKDANSKKRAPSNDVIVSSFDLVIHGDGRREFQGSKTWEQLEPRWRATGVDANVLRRFRAFLRQKSEDEQMREANA